MIGKQSKGTSFRGLLNYLDKEDGLIIGGNMVGETPRELSTEFALSRQLNPNLERAVYHSSLSLPKTESLDNDTWNEVARDYLKGMGFSDSQYVIYRHHDKEHDHIHLVASRIRITDGKTVSDSWDYVRSEKLVRELEHKYSLTPTISSHLDQQRGQTTGEIRLIERTGAESVRAKLHQAIDAETSNPISMPKLVNKLKDRGIDAQISITRTGLIRGISYKLDGIAFTGTKLGKGYTFPGLQKHRQVSYDQNIHREKLILAGDRTPLNLVAQQQKKDEFNKQAEIAQKQQKERALIIAPILKDYINEIKEVEIEIPKYQIHWKKSEKTLYLYKKSESQPRLKIKYENKQFEIIESADSIHLDQPRLKKEDVDHWLKFKKELRSIQKQKQQKKQQRKGRGMKR